MFCPQCGTENSLAQKYCRQRGLHLHAARVAINGRADEALIRYRKDGSIFLLLSVLAALTNIFLNAGPRNYAVNVNLLIGLIITGPMITAGIVRLRRVRRTIQMKDVQYIREYGDDMPEVRDWKWSY